MALIYDPANGEMRVTDDPESFFSLGWRTPTPEEADHFAKTDEFGGFAQQAQAQVERVVRGATFGAVEGFGDDPEAIQARADVSREESPITSFAADVLPDIGVAAVTGGLGGLATGAGRAAGRAALAEGGGLVRAGLAAARAGGAAALASESVGTGLVGAGQSAFAEGRDFADDPGKFAEDALIWGGLNFGLGSILGHGAPKSAESLTAPLDEAAAESLDDIAKAAEFRAPKETSAAIEGAPALAPEVTAAAPAELTEQETAALNNAKSSLGFLRNPKGKLKDALAPALEKTMVEDPGTLFRGLRLSEEQLDAITRDGYELTELTVGSPDRAVAERFAGGTDSKLPVLMQLEGTPRASMAHGYAGDSLPDEVSAILPKGQRYRVASVEDVAIAPEKDWMGPQTGKLVKLEAIVDEAPVPAGAVRIGEREAVDGGLERALRNASKSDADDLVDQAVRAPVPEQEANSFGRQRRLYINRDAINEVATREMQRDLSSVVKDVEQVTRADKLASIAASVGDNVGAQRASARGIAEDAARFAGELRAEAREYGAAAGKKGLQYALPSQQKLTLALMDNAKELQKAGTGKAMFEALDSFKRTMQDYKLSLEQGSLVSPESIHYQALIPKVEAFAGKLRSALEDPGTWGKAGDMQRAYNAVITDQLMPSWRIFEEKTLQRTSKSYEGTWNVEGWESKLSSLLKDADPGARRHVGAVLDAMDELGGVRRQFGDAKTAARIEDGVAKIRRTIGLADEVADATERMKALGEIVGGVPYGGAIAGGLAGGFPGAAIGAALPGAVRGFVMGDLISAFQRLSGATDAAVARGVDDWIRSSRVRGAGLRGLTSKLPKLSGEAKQLAEVAARRGVSHGMALFMGEDSSPASAFERIRGALLDDDKFFQSLSDDYGTLQQESPDVYMALAGRASIARQFLIQRMPPNIAVSMAQPNGYPPNRESIEDWAVYVNAVRYPTRLAKNPGALRVQEVETLQAVHPRLYELLQQQTIVGMARAQAAGEKLDDTLLARVNLLFPEVDGAGSPVFSKEFGQAVRDYNAMQKQKGGGSTAPMKPRELTTPQYATMQSGATFGTVG